MEADTPVAQAQMLSLSGGKKVVKTHSDKSMNNFSLIVFMMMRGKIRAEKGPVFYRRI